MFRFIPDTLYKIVSVSNTLISLHLVAKLSSSGKIAKILQKLMQDRVQKQLKSRYRLK